MATNYFQDPFGAADYSAEGMPNLLSLSNLESLARGNFAGLLGFPEDLRRSLTTKKMQENMDFLSSQSGIPQVPYFLPSSEELKQRTPRMTAPTPQAGLLEDVGAFMYPVPAAAVGPLIRGGKGLASMAGARMAENVVMGRPNLPGLLAEPPSALFATPPGNKLPPKPTKAAARNQKRGSTATVFDDVTDYDEAMRLARSGAHLKQDASGQYIGGPRSDGKVGITVDSPQALGGMRASADAKVAAGDFNATWYDRARETSKNLTNYNSNFYGPSLYQESEMASLFPRGGAAYSPQATPPTEVNSFIRQHNAKVFAGQDVIPRTKSQATNVARAYEFDPTTGGYKLSPENIKLGKKTGPYADAKDPTVPAEDLYKTASDIWHGRVMGYSDPGGKTFSRGFTPQEHGFLTGENLLLADRAEAKRLAGEINVPDASPDFIFDPRASQAATWGSQRFASYKAERDALVNQFEKQQAKYDRQLEKWNINKIGKKPTKPRLKDAGKATDEELLARARAGIDDAVQRQMASMTYEYIPGEKVMPGLNVMDEAKRIEFSEGMQAPFGNRDPYVRALQGYQFPTVPIEGQYLNSAGVVEKNRGYLTQPAVGLENSIIDGLTSSGKVRRGGPQLDQYGREMLNRVSGVRAGLDAQEGVGWNKFTPANSSMKTVEKTGVRFEPMVNADVKDADKAIRTQMSAAQKALEKAGLDVVNIGDALHAGKFDGSLSGNQIQAIVKKVKAKNKSGGSLIAGRFESGLESPPWGPQGSGQVAKYLEQQLTDPGIQNFAQRLDVAKVPKQINDQTQFMTDFFQKNGLPMRSDYLKLREIIGKQGFQGFLDYVKKNGYQGLPVAAGASLVGGGLLGSDDQGQ